MIELTELKTMDPLQTMNHAIATVDSIYALSKDYKSEIGIDMSKINWIMPTSIILVSSCIKSFKDNKCEVKIKFPDNKNTANYLKTLSFPGGNAEGVLGETYTTIINFEKNPQEAANTAIKLLKKIFPEIASGSPLSYLVSELIDNIEEHSEYKNGFVLGQYYKKKNVIDVCIYDDGISIPTCFAKNNVPFNQGKTATEMAFEGVSTKEEEGGRGYGLRSSSRIVTDGLNGDFLLFSGEGILHINPSGTKNFYKLENTHIPGTLINLRYHVPEKNVDITPYYQG